jgi:hypothetical protein
MKTQPANIGLGMRKRLMLAFLVWVLLIVSGIVYHGARVAHGAEVIPSVGFTRLVDGDDEAAISGGLAFRGALLAPILQGELGVSYRSESRFSDQLKVRMWPVTASAWLFPVPTLYAGAGVGYYNVTFDYDEDTLGQIFDDETTQEFGVHVGGGVRLPMAPRAALDLNGRYVMLRDQEDRLVPENFDPDFWTASIGLAIGF